MSNILTDDTYYQSGLVDKYNQFVPSFMHIGDTTNIDGKKYHNNNKNYNIRKVESIDNQFLDLSKETDNPLYPVFYKLVNINNGAVKHGITSTSVAERYSGIDMTAWEVVYEHRRFDARKLEKDINGNRSLLKKRKVDLARTKYSIPSGATEILTSGFDKASRLLDTQQRDILENALEGSGVIPKHHAEKDLKLSPAFNAKSARVLNSFGVDLTDMSPEDISQKMVEELSGFNMNLGDTATIAYKMQSKDQSIAKDFADILEAYDYTDTDGNQVWRGFKEIISDPTNLLVVPSLGMFAPAKFASNATAKIMAKQAMKSAVKRDVAVGAVEGMIYTTADDLLKQSVNKKAGNQKEINLEQTATSALLGAGVGVGLGSLTGYMAGKAKGKEIVKEADIRSSVYNLLNPNVELKADDIPIQPQNPSIKNKQIAPEIDDEYMGVLIPDTKGYATPSENLLKTKKIPIERKQISTVKKKNKDIIVTKDGHKFKSKEVAASQRAANEAEFEVVEPRKDAGVPLKGYDKEKRKTRTKKFTTELEAGGRVHIEDGSLLSYKGASGQKAALKLKPKQYEKTIDLQVDKQMLIYDDEQKTIKAYGKKEAKLDKPKEELPEVSHYNREEFRASEYEKLADKAPTGKAKTLLKQRAKDIKEANIKPFEGFEGAGATAKKQYESQFKFKTDNKNRQSRVARQKQRYKVFSADKSRIEKSTLSGKDILNKLEENNKTAKTELIELVEEIKLKEREQGNLGFDYNNPTAKQLKEYPKQLREINNILDKVLDVRDFKAGQLGMRELQYRAKRRIDERFDSMGTSSSANNKDFLDLKKSLEQEYEDIGVKIIASEPEYAHKLKKDKATTTTTNSKKDDKAKEMLETKELKESTSVHDNIVKLLERYTIGKPIALKKTGARKGEDIISASQKKMLDDKILTTEEIANLSAPISLSKDRARALADASAFANKKVSDYKRKQLGITKQNIKQPPEIEFKDDIGDASNSMLQIVATSLSDSKLGKYSGLAGVKGTLREEIGESMSKELGINYGKAEVKKMYTPQFYGSGDNAIINGVMGKDNVTRARAEEIVQSYFKHLNKAIPELEPLREAIRNRMLNGSPDMKWTFPDGMEVKKNFSRIDNVKFNVKNKTSYAQLSSNEIDNYSSALFPSIIQSIDAYLIRKVNKAGIPGNHDSWLGNNIKAIKIYKEGLVEINETNLLQDIFDQAGIDFQIKKGTLSSDEIRKSKFVADIEHKAGTGLDAKDYAESIRKPDVSRMLTTEEVMLDYAASGGVTKQTGKSLEQQYIEAASYRDMSSPNSGDDMFLRQLALAHHSNKYSSKNSIKPPKGVHKKVWNITQKNLFNRFRARLEFNPHTRIELEGDLIYTNKYGKALNTNTKTYQELLNEEIRKSKSTEFYSNGDLKYEQYETIMDFPKVSKWKARETPPLQYRKVLKKVEEWSQKDPIDISAEQLEVIKQVHQNKEVSPTEMTSSQWEQTKTYLADQYRRTDESVEIEEMFNERKNAIDEPAKRAEAQNAAWKKRLDEKQDKEWFKQIFRTGMHTVRKDTKESAEKFAKKWDFVYKQAQPAIDQGAKALGNASEQIGSFLNNSMVIARHYGLSDQYVEVIDRLISIKAMTDESWDFLAKHKGDKDFIVAMNTIGTNKKLSSAKLFGTNRESMITGFVSEFYDGNREIVGDTTRYSGASKRELGVVPSAKDKNKVGTRVTYLDPPAEGFKDRATMEAWALKNKAKITERGLRKIADYDLKLEAGLSTKFSDAITATTYSIDDKLSHKKLYSMMLEKLDGDSPIISSVPKEGFRPLSQDEISNLPWETNQKYKFVNIKYAEEMMGRDEIRLWGGSENSSQWARLTNRLWKDRITAFKQNAVLKNLPSFRSAMMVNQTIGMTLGVDPVKYIKAQADVIPQIIMNDKLRSRISNLKAQGKNYSKFTKKLEASELYQMEMHGLSTNRLDGTVGSTTLLNQVLSDATEGKFDAVVNNIMLNQNSTAGHITTTLFSAFDTQGRYAVTKHYLDSGLGMNEAVQKANDLFGNMDKMAPAWIELLDSHGLAPFLKWYARTSPGLVAAVKDNPTSALLTGIFLFGASQATDQVLSNVNPVEAAIDMGDDFVSAELYDNIKVKGYTNAIRDKLSPYVLPRYMTSLYKKAQNPDGYNILFKENMRAGKLDYRGLVRKTIEDNVLASEE